MPIRPPAYEWQLDHTSDLATFSEAVRHLAEQLGAKLELDEADEGVHSAVLVLDPGQLARALEDRGLSDDELDPPQGDRYRLVVSWSASDDEYPAPRLAVDPQAGDNWAAWMLAGMLGNDLAEAFEGHEITGDPPPWLARELARTERPSSTRLPWLAIRRSPLFPGNETVLEVGRAESVATIRRMFDQGRDELVACLQRDPAAAQPAQLADFFPVASALRLLRVVPQGGDGSMLVIAKSVARVRLLQLDIAAREVEIEVAVADDDLAIDVADLRRLARFDTMIESSAGMARVAASQTMPPGALCDLIAAHGDRPEAYAPVLQAVDVASRVRVIRELFADLCAR